jgi:hypothetical protein
MRTLIRLSGLVSLSLGLVSSAWAWGAEGHKTVGDLARARLTPAARAEVTKILGNDDLGAVASWADDLRGAASHYGPLVADADAQSFNRKFPHNGSWHFVDLEVGTPAYDDNGPLSGPDDVVHALNRSISTLEGTDTGMTKAQALKFIIHLVGDIHQPLHSTSGYYDLSDPDHPKLLVYPAKIDAELGDRGGNLLFTAPRKELHAYWDSVLVEKIVGKDETKLVTLLSSRTPSGWQTAGDYHQWAEAWATESCKIATADVFGGLKFGPAEMKTAERIQQITITVPADYAEKNEVVVEDQLAKAGLRLADLLNHLHWSS